MTADSGDVLNAILFMDAYNRTENQGVFLNGYPDVDDLTDIQIGDVKILRTSNLEYASQSFYAIAYQKVGPNGVPTGPIIISYRGTDNFTLDPITGWSVGAGKVLNNQAALTVQFYEDVVKQVTGVSNFSIFDALPANAPVIELTGHSLGGGLAGLVAALSGNHATIYDHMPFGTAA